MPRRRTVQHHARMPPWLQRGHALRRPRGFWLRAAFMLALLLGATWAVTWLDPLPPPLSGRGVASDGDSLRLGRDRIRLWGIDAPELDQICWSDAGQEWPCGRTAYAALRDRLAAGAVACRARGTDRYRRILATCSVSGKDVAALLVAEGLALSRNAYGGEERAARAARLGLWQGRFADPKSWRDFGPTADPGPSLLETLWDALRELTGARTLR